MGKPDPFLNLLKDIGYLPLRLPRAGVEPLQMMQVEGKDLSILGDLSDLMIPQGSATLPPVKLDIQTANQVQGTKTSQVKLNVGLNILSNILHALTGNNLDVSAAFDRASTITFQFTNVTVDAVSIILLDKFLNQSIIDQSARQIQDVMVKGNAAVTTSVAKTNKYVVSAQDSNGVDVQINVPVIQGIAGGSVGITSNNTSNTSISFEGTAQITFGVQAIRLGFDQNGRITGFKQVGIGDAAVRGLEESGESAPNFVSVGGVFGDLVDQSKGQGT